jgi:hypothetical protein
MSGQSSLEGKAQLDKSEREHLEDVVTELRETVEADIEYQFEHAYELQDENGGRDLSGEDVDVRTELVTAVEREEDDDKSWDEKFDRYVMGVGYTIVNRLTALRCMEVRGFIDRPVTQFGESDLTPAAEKLHQEEYINPNEAIVEAYDRVCRDLTEEIEILFDPDSPYSIVDPTVDTFKDLCRKLDEIPDAVWRADDVLGWVYEYYNASKLDELRRKGDHVGLEPEDVPPANQFYTPHWVVRMLTDNSLAKMYLESKGELHSTIEKQSSISVEERKSRDGSPTETPSLADFSTYLVPTEDESEPPEFEEPKDIRVIDPACGSGHFLLYAFDILERIWHRERPDLDRAKIPEKILRHNLYGIDLDLRACQLAAFNLYLKARGRSEEEGASNFEIPEIGIVCADTKIANVEAVSEVFDEVADDQPEIRDALEDILTSFENVQGLGSLLDVRGTLEDEFQMDEQPTITESISGPGSLSKFLNTLHNKVTEHRNGESFFAQDLKSFLRVLVILSQDYDVALMNPPYGSRNRMPDLVKEYVKEHYKYKPEFYINFFEVCDRLVKDNGRIGMLVPRTFMFKQSYQDFRDDFIGERGSFEFLAEFGMGVLDNATVRTAGTVVKSGDSKGENEVGEFFRLHDIQREEKEQEFLTAGFSSSSPPGTVQRRYTKEIEEFSMIPGSPMSYWVPSDIRELYQSNTLFENRTDTDQDSLGVARAGLQTSDDERFLRYFWEVGGDFDYWKPYAKGGEDAWTIPRITYVVAWGEDGSEIKRYPPSIVPNEQYYFSEVLAFTYIKEGGKRFGYLNSQSIFGHSGFVFIPNDNIWHVMAYANSNLFTYLMLAQTTGRHWNVGEISKIPWNTDLAEITELESTAKDAAGDLLAAREHDFNSPYYSGPLLAKVLGKQTDLPLSRHPHRDLKDSITPTDIPEKYGPDSNLETLLEAAHRYRDTIKQRLSERSNRIDEILFDYFELDESERDAVLREIALRTSENPLAESSESDSYDFVERKDDEELVKELVHHVSVNVVHQDDDGIVLLGDSIEEEDSLHEMVVANLSKLFGEYAEDRIAEIDQVLGDKKPDEGAYPNLEFWIENELFDYHLTQTENTPILWKLTSRRLVSDSKEEGLGCLIDYQKLDAGLFDRIESRYIEPLKSSYRERRNAADQRRSDSSLSTSEQAKAAEEFDRYERALTQINEFQEMALELSATHTREDDDSVQAIAQDLKPKVAEFRRRTETRLETLDKLKEEMDPDEFENLFSPTFYERVAENREEWITALEDLETACKEYSKDRTSPVGAHLYDLFIYFDDLVGTTHYGSNGIFFMNYYFSKGEEYLENGEPREGLEGEIRLLAKLAAETDEDVELGKEINDKCDSLSKTLPSDWEERALSEVLTSGYDPVKKHGVEINIQPLAEKKIVPEIVEDKVVN